MKTNRTRRIAIVGAGVAGLTLAAALDAQRFEVVLCEAQPDRPTGAALGLWPHARRELSSLGIGLQGAEPDRRLAVHRLDGRRIITVPTPSVAQVMRPTLMRDLSQAVPDAVQWQAEEVLDPTRLSADLVVGADGVRSQVRAVVSPRQAERRATPWVTLRGIATGEPGATRDAQARGAIARDQHAMGCVTPGEAREFWGGGRLFGDAPVAGGRYWFSAHRGDASPEPLDPQAVLTEAREQFRDACRPVRDILEDAEPDHTLATRLWTAPPLARYRNGRYLVIGDAAHGSLPNLGRGASDAIVDAMTLARTLNSDGSLRQWEARRVPATQGARIGAGFVMRCATALP